MSAEAKGWFDGSITVNPGGVMGIGAVLTVDGEEVGTVSELRGTGTVNVAEWQALIALLELAVEKEIVNLTVYGDSQVICYQATGKYKVNYDHLRAYKQRFDRLKQFDFVELNVVWIRREQNQRADELSKQCHPHYQERHARPARADRPRRKGKRQLVAEAQTALRSPAPSDDEVP